MLGLAYQTYKGLLRQKGMDQQLKGAVNRELKAEAKQCEEHLVRILMKW